MKWILIAVLLANPIEMPKKLPKPPEHPIIRFLNKDLWELYDFTRQCVDTSITTVCVKAKGRNIESGTFFLIFRKKF